MSDLVIRVAVPDDARAIAQVRVDAWRTTYRGMIPDAYLAAMSVDDSEALWSRVLNATSSRASVIVAANGRDIVGFAAGNLLAEPKHGLDAELTAIYLRRGSQRAGIGSRLVGAVVGAVVAAERPQGATGLITWVIAGNKGARAFYERLGAELLIERPFQWDGMDLVEVGYGWRSLDALAAALSRQKTIMQEPAATVYSGEKA
jgi:GNAT superfamily N-acetyltransferase